MLYCKLFLIAACGLLLGCAATPTTIPATPQHLPTAPALANDILAIYHKSGGIAGIDETFVVYQGGKLELTTRGSNTKNVQVDELQIQPLRRMLEQKEFGELQPLYQARGADLITYTITARTRSGNMRSVSTMDGAKPPAYLGQLIAMFEQLRAQVK